MVFVSTMIGFGVSSIRFQPVSLVYASHSFTITCNAVPRKQLQSQPQIAQGKEETERRHNAMKQLLMEQCGFSSSDITEVLNKDPTLFRIRSIARAQEAVDLFKESGFTSSQVRNTIRRYPSVLSRKTHEQLKPKIVFFRTLGFAGKEVAQIISKKPIVLGLSLSKSMRPKIPLLVNLFGSKAIVIQAVRRAPAIFVYDIETLKTKLKFIGKMGLSENEITQLISKDSMFLCLSTDKIQKNMDFLINTARFDPGIVVTYPQLLNLSVDNRLKPRYDVFAYLKSTLSPEYPPFQLVTMLCMSEDEFTERFLEVSSEAKRLYTEKKRASLLLLKCPEDLLAPRLIS